MKKLIFTLVIMVLGLGLFANPVSLQSAQQVAVNYYTHIAMAKTTDYTVSDVLTMQKDGLTTFYVFNFKSGGFVMVSADDAVTPILGYSESNTFDTKNIHSNVQSWLNDYSKQIKSIVDANLDNSETSKEWKNIRNKVFSSAKAGAKDVAALVTTTWNQDSYSGADCPNKICGCVALAMGQVLHYWGTKTGSGALSTGVGTHSYLEPNSGSLLTVNFGTTTYSWSSMPTASSSNASYATLCYDCGVAVNMSYSTSTGESGANQADIPRALIENFGYQPSAEVQFYSNFPGTTGNADWIAMLQNELNNGRPVLYAGSDATQGGHSFVFDGYKTSGSTFHVNWGWGASGGNGYFAVGSLNPTGYAFNLDNQAVIRVHPKSAAPIANFTISNTSTAAIGVGGSVTFTDLSTNSPTTWTWTFEGGTPATYTGQTPPTVNYATAGKYLVSLTVTNATGNDTKTVSRMINVGETQSAWIMQNLGFPKDNLHYNRMVSQLDVVSPKVVWATIIDGYASAHNTNEFAITKDGGNTWKLDTLKFTYTSGTTTYPSTNYGIANIQAFDSLNAWAAMYPLLMSNGGLLAKTTNGGTTWTAVDPGYTSGNSSWLDFVHFFNTTNGVCVGDPTSSSAASKFGIYYTTNGGTNWTASTSVTTASSTGLDETSVNSAPFDSKGDTMWFGTTKGRICKSLDYGKTWTATATGFGTTNNPTVTPVFKDYLTGIITASNSAGTFLGIKTTTNGGTTWTAVTPTGYYVKNPYFAYIPEDAMWVDITGYPGSGSSYSTNNGTSFLNIDTGSVPYYCVKFQSVNAGWAGSMFTNTGGGIYHWNPAEITGINEHQNNINSNQLEYYPNPASSVVNISGIDNNKAIVNVYNLIGAKILTKEFSSGSGNIIQLDLSGIVEGIYLISVDTGNKIVTKRISIIK